ncbi:MAG: PHP domain-containing protein, partial [Oscillospiraceae bacterium]|nr:PHP domain-containing protein [Oscillospiraceae bacterium]
MENNGFISVFGEIPENEQASAAFSGCRIDNIKIHFESRKMELELSFPALVSEPEIEYVEELLKSRLDLSEIEIFPKMPSALFSEGYFSSLVKKVNASVAASNGFFVGASAGFDGTTLSVHLTHGGKNILEACGCREFMERLIFDRFSRNVAVEFLGEEISVEDEAYTEMIRTAEDNNLRAKGIDPEEVRAAASKPKEHKIIEGIPLYFETAHPVLGSKITKKPRPLSEISIEDGSCVVWGDVFGLEVRETRDGRSNIVTFNITDRTYAYSCKIFEKKEYCAHILEKVTDGATLLIRGDLTFDKYSGETVISPKAISTIQKIPPIDDAEEKRVELHLHTKMSMMDGMTDAKLLVKRAIAWGHKAIAITDHGVVQAFPEAIAAAGGKIKVILGMEGYFINDDEQSFEDWKKEKKAKYFHQIILAKNSTGLKNLYKLISLSNVKYFHRRPIIPKSELMRHREGLIIGSACEAGELYRAIATGQSDETILKIASFYDYLEIQPCGNNRYMIDSERFPLVN